MWLKQCHFYHLWLGMVNILRIDDIYGDDWEDGLWLWQTHIGNTYPLSGWWFSLHTLIGYLCQFPVFFPLKRGFSIIFCMISPRFPLWFSIIFPLFFPWVFHHFLTNVPRNFWLVVWNKFDFSRNIPTDFQSIIFQRGRAQPPTRLRTNYMGGVLFQ